MLISLQLVLSPSAPPVSANFIDCSVSLLHTTAPPIRSQSLLYYMSLCNTCSLPPLPVWYGIQLDCAHTRHPPASTACLCAPICMPVSAAISRVHYPSLCLPCHAPRISYHPLGGVPVVGPVNQQLKPLCYYRGNSIDVFPCLNNST